MRKSWIMLLAVFSFTLLSGCYSFKGISIEPDVNTYYVGNFKNNAVNSPPVLPQTAAEALREKLRTETRLKQSNTAPDIEFKGTIVDFRVTSEAPKPGESTAINRLTIVTAIEYVNNKYEKKGWKNNFSFFYDFPSNQSLSSVQDDAVTSILDQMMEDIFNKAFTDW